MPGLGRRFAPDPRDRKFSIRRAAPMVTAKKRYDRVFYRTPAPLDQGNTDQCVEFGWQLFLGAFPTYGTLLPRRTIYDLAQSIDEFPDTPPAGGTSVRAGAKALVQLGHLKYYVWPDNVDDAVRWLQAGAGIVVSGTVWLDSMFDPDADGRIIVDWNSGIAGGHCYDYVGFDPAHHFERSGVVLPAFRIQNSWGAGWSQRGRAWLALEDARALIAEDGELCCGVEALADTN